MPASGQRTLPGRPRPAGGNRRDRVSAPTAPPSSMSPGIGTLDFSLLAQRVGHRLIRVQAPLRECLAGGDAARCAQALANLRNPYAIEDDPGAFHTTGWLGAFDAGHSPVAVAAETPADIAAAVDFARDHGLGLVIKGTGHDYLGRSSAPSSLLVWTHRMRDITVHDAFTPAGPGGPGVPAVTVGAGARWLEVYQAAARHGRLVQGGGCTSVGAAGGFTQGGGFGPLSRRYGTAAGNVLEIEVVTASGEILVANAGQHTDLFWALRGGGGGTFGVVSKLTMRTHPMPSTVGIVVGAIKAATNEDFRNLIRALVRFLPDLCDDHWGEQVRLSSDNTAGFFMTGCRRLRGGSTRDLAAAPRLGRRPPRRLHLGRVRRGDPVRLVVGRQRLGPDGTGHGLSRRPAGPAARTVLVGHQPGRGSQYLHAYQSRWLPLRLFHEQPGAVADALFRRIPPVGHQPAPQQGPVRSGSRGRGAGQGHRHQPCGLRRRSARDRRIYAAVRLSRGTRLRARPDPGRGPCPPGRPRDGRHPGAGA